MGPIIVATRGTSAVPEFAGSTWVRLQYVLGLRSLGIRAVWVDRLKESVDRQETRRSLSYFTRRFEQMARDFGFADSYFIAAPDGSRLAGMTIEELDAVCERAELLISISESPPPGSPLLKVQRKAYMDVDPGFTQIWIEQFDMGLDGFDSYFTTGLNVGGAGFEIPIGERVWHPTPPPVALDHWPCDIDERCESFSTVTDWHAAQQATSGAEVYRGKRPEFMKVIDLPKRSGQRLTLAVGIEGHYPDAVMLTENGWELVDSYRFAGDVYAYREFIQHSRAEFSVAKHGYVKSRSGWVSDRTAAYLASGKPALVQSTGFEDHLPAGRGLLTFRDLDEAAAGIAAINADYPAHCRAARALAETHFDARVVLPNLMRQAGVVFPAR